MNFAYSVPRTGTITSIAAYFSVTLGITLLGTANVTAQLFRSTTPDNIFSPIAGAEVNLPPLTGLLTLGANVHALTSGLSITVNPEDRLLMVFSVTTSGILGVATTLAGYASAGVAIS